MTDIVYNGNEIILVTNPVITEGQEVEVTYTDSTPEMIREFAMAAVMYSMDLMR